MVRSLVLAIAILSINSVHVSAAPLLPYFGLELFDYAKEDYPDGFLRQDGFFLQGDTWTDPFCVCPAAGLFTGKATITTGPLERLEAIFDPASGLPAFTTYDYAGGEFNLLIEWVSPLGVKRSGTFSAPIVGSFNFYGSPVGLSPGVVLKVREDEEPEWPDIYPKVEAVLLLGPGEFSPALAKFLGYEIIVPKGEFSFSLETITGGPFQ